MTKLVTIVELPQERIAWMRTLRPDLEVVYVAPRDEQRLLAELADAEIVHGGSGELFKRMIQAAPRARWMDTPSAGVDDALCPEFFQRDFILTSGKGVSVANLLAEHAMALLLALTRQLVPAARATSWQREAYARGPTEIAGLTMGIVGLGAVGQALAVRACAFGLEVVGTRAHPGVLPPGVSQQWGAEGLPELLTLSDVVVLILPNTPETEASFGIAELRLMKPTALLINVGRGQTVDSAALEHALIEGWIAGAGLDVMPVEPWPSESPLWQMDNVLITPHIAGNSPQRAARNLEAFCANFERYTNGEPLLSVVSREGGY